MYSSKIQCKLTSFIRISHTDRNGAQSNMYAANERCIRFNLMCNTHTHTHIHTHSAHILISEHSIPKHNTHKPPRMIRLVKSSRCMTFIHYSIILTQHSCKIVIWDKLKLTTITQTMVEKKTELNFMRLLTIYAFSTRATIK